MADGTRAMSAGTTHRRPSSLAPTGDRQSGGHARTPKRVDRSGEPFENSSGRSSVAKPELPTTVPGAPDAEILPLARRLSEAFRALVSSRQEMFDEGAEDAERRVRAADDPEWQ